MDMTSCESPPGEILADLEPSDQVRLAVADEQYEGTARRKTVAGDHIRAVVRTGEDQVFRITSEWVHGWLDPLVDEYVDEDRVQPVGTLAQLEVVETDGGMETDGGQ